MRFQIFTIIRTIFSNVSEEPTFLLRRRRKCRTYETSLHFVTGFGRSTHGKEHQVTTEQKLGGSHSQTRLWEEKKFCLVLSRTPVIYSLASHCDVSIVPAANITWQLDADAMFLRTFLKHTRRVSLMYWTYLNTVMKSSLFMGCKNPLSWLQQPAAGSCFGPEESSLHSHSPSLFSKILRNDVSQLKIEG